MRFMTCIGECSLLAAFVLIVVALPLNKNHDRKNPLETISASASDAATAFEPSPMDRAEASLAAATADPVVGTTWTVYGKTACQGDGNPLVLPRTKHPTAGKHVVVDWWTYPTSPPPPPAYSCVLLVSTKPSTPIDLSIWHADGCWLLVVPEWSIQPQAGTILSQNGGNIHLDWIPDVAFIGGIWYMQLIVAEPGKNGLGYKTSPMLKLLIGG